MSNSEAPLQLFQLLQYRKPTLQQVIDFIQQLHNAKKEENLIQRISIINCIIKNLVIATKLWLETVTKYRYEICFDPLHSQIRRTQRRKSATGKKRQYDEGETERKDVTIEEILADAVQMSMSFSNSPQIITPRRHPIQTDQHNLSTLPPLHLEPISIQSLDETAFTSMHQADVTAAEEKMMTYHKVLAGVAPKEEASLIKPPNLNNTRKKRNTATKKKTSVRDEDIYLDDEGPTRQLKIENLATKVKMARESQGNPTDSFQNRLKEINPTLVRIEQLRNKLKLKFEQRQQMPEETGLYESYHESYLQNTLEQKFTINESNNPSITAALQSKLTHILEAQLFKEPKVAFGQFCSKRVIKRQIKGQLFYQLLHMDFPLEQRHPESFDDIFINPK